MILSRTFILAFASTALLVGGASATPKTNPADTSFTGHELSGAAKITLAQARVIALKARPGKVVDQELEKEAGGAGLRYSFDVKNHGTTYEVGVDAATGKVLENGAEGPAKEALEAKTEKVEASTHP